MPAVIQANIARYRDMLETCTDEMERQQLQKLIEELIGKLQQLGSSAPPWRPPPTFQASLQRQPQPNAGREA